jgi:hypothetical protein
VTRAIAFAVVLAATAAAPAADEALQPILDLYKSGKLFEKAEYKAVRAASAKVFEARRGGDIKDAFGDDHAALTAWLEKHKELKEEFFSAIDEQKDDVPRVLAIFRDLWKDDAEAVGKYSNLAIAVSVVWDNPKGIYDYRGHQVRTKSRLPEGYDKHGHRDEFKYHIGRAKALQGKEAANRLEVLPWEFLVYVVNHKTPVEERDWAIKNYLPKRPMIGKVYQEIEYDKVMLETQSKVCKLNDHDYTLADIKRYGGVCAMQADFAARVGKSLGVPAAFVGGEAQNLVLHAWVMWVEVKSASKTSVNFKLESFGRYQLDHYYTGELIDPQTGEEILDRDMERRLSVAATERTGKRQADLAMSYFQDVAGAAKLEPKKKVQYLLSALRVSVYNEAAWLELARMARQGEIPAESKSFVLEQADWLVRGFAQYPDFTWRVAGDLLTLQKDTVNRNKFYERLIIVYETANRPDLACEARLKWAEFLGEEKKWSLAAVGLKQTILKFPDEGRYVPKMMDKLKEACGQFTTGKDYLAKTYVELIKKMTPKRGTEVTKYFTKMSGEALEFLKDAKKTKEAAEVEQIRRSAGVTGTRTEE